MNATEQALSILMASPQFAEYVRERGAEGALAALPPFIAHAVTTGDAVAQEINGTLTINLVTVWLDGAAQTADNKLSVVLPYGQAAPGTGEYWAVLLSNFERKNAMLLRRIA